MISYIYRYIYPIITQSVDNRMNSTTYIILILIIPNKKGIATKHGTAGSII